MDMKSQSITSDQGNDGNRSGYGTGEIPEFVSEAIFRRGRDEAVLWRGRPSFWRLAATAFHTNSVAVYFALLAVFAFATDGAASAATVAIMGVSAFLILLGLAYLYAKKSMYILTNQRVVLLTGIAFEKRISIPLKYVVAAHLKRRSKDHGDIALEISGNRQLGYLLLWPHVRPFRYLTPQPLLRVVPDAETVAQHLAKACAANNPISLNLTQVNDVGARDSDQECATAFANASAEALDGERYKGAHA
ncbi:MAG: photosynthetic complex putative assembly protein PuhB [Pseudomonadota bacterium]